MICPSPSVVPTFLDSIEDDSGYRCLEVLIKDAAGGIVFQVEPGSPYEDFATLCVITDVAKLVKAGPVYPPKVPIR